MSGVGCSRPGCLFHHAEVASAGPQGDEHWKLGAPSEHPPKASKASKASKAPRYSERKTSQAVATDEDIHLGKSSPNGRKIQVSELL